MASIMTKSQPETIGSMGISESPTDMRQNPLRGEATAARLNAANKELERLQTAFDENFRSLTEPVKHDVTSVLMLSWEKEGSDMDVSAEIETLASLFKDEYHFIVEHQQLKENESTQFQLNIALSQFMMKNNNPHNLCIIYYAGHGFTQDGPGKLYLTNNSSQQSLEPNRRKRNHIAWHRAEENIRTTLADVLVIFDCCYAGALQDFRSSEHSFEFLGACGHDQLTPGPGRQSFTSALIWALRQLQRAHGFDSAELRKTVTAAPHFRAGADYRRQTPVLFHRERPNEDHVWIAPTARPGEELPPSPSRPSPHYRVDLPMEYLDLRFRFSKRQDEAQVEELAKALSQFVRERGSDMGVRRVDLRDHVTVSTVVRDVARFWKLSVSTGRSERSRDDVVSTASRDEGVDDGGADRVVARTLSLSDDGALVRRDSAADGEEKEVQNLRVGVLRVEHVDDKPKFTARRVAAIAVKAFVAGIMLSLFFWYQFFLTPYARIIALWEAWVRDGLPEGGRSLMLGENSSCCS